MDIYVKPTKKVNVNKTGFIKIKDVAKVYAADGLKNKIENIILLNIRHKKDKCYLITIIDIINAIDMEFPNNTINNVGEMDTIVEFNKVKENNKVLNAMKICFVFVLLFIGSATAIMSFHSDAQIPAIFENYYYIVFGEAVSRPAIINLPYSIGLALGIIIFFNHFAGKKLTNDPTPIQVEMTVYDNDVTSNIVDILSKEEDNDNN